MKLILFVIFVISLLFSSVGIGADQIDSDFLNALIEDIPRSIEQEGQINASIIVDLIDEIEERKNNQLNLLEDDEDLQEKPTRTSDPKKARSLKLISFRATKKKTIASLDKLRSSTGNDPAIDQAIRKIKKAYSKLESILKKKENLERPDKDAFYRSYYDVYSDIRDLGKKYGLPIPPSYQHKIVSGLNTDPDLMKQVTRQINEALLTNYKKPETGKPIPLFTRQYIARMANNIYWAYHYPVKESVSNKRLKKYSTNKSNGPFQDRYIAKSVRFLKKLYDMGPWINSLESVMTGLEFNRHLGPKLPECFCEETGGCDEDDESLATPIAVIRGKPIGTIDFQAPNNFCAPFGTSSNCQLEGGKIILDPGHLGGEGTEDDRYYRKMREGHGTFVTAQLLKYILNICLDVPPEQIVVTRPDLFSVGGVKFTKDKKGQLVPITEQGKENTIHEALKFRGAYINAITGKDDIFLSLHTDGSPKQEGLILHSRGADDPASSFAKTPQEAARSKKLANIMASGLNQTFFADGEDSNECKEITHFQRSGFSTRAGDYSVIGAAAQGNAVIVEGFSHTDTLLSSEIHAASKDEKKRKPYTKSIKVSGQNYTFHKIYECYAKGLAHGIHKQLTCE